LSPHIDHLFDQGFISFADDGALILSPQADIDTLHRWGIDPNGNYGSFKPGQLPYLAFHREFVFRR
jgi:putative restriction endonuclease